MHPPDVVDAAPELGLGFRIVAADEHSFLRHILFFQSSSDVTAVVWLVIR